MNKNRLNTITFAIIVSLLIIITRYFYWQIIKSGELKKNTLQQSYKIEVNNPARGLIFSSDNFPIVQNQTVYQLSLYKPNFKQSLSEIVKKIDALSPNFISTYQLLIDHFDNEPLQKWITLPLYFDYSQQVALNHIPGVSFSSSTKRYYPEDRLAFNLLTNIESYYTRLLSGKPGFFRLSKDALGNGLLLGNNWQSLSVDGSDIHLFLNRPLQFLVEKKIKEGVDSYQADSGSITIIDPKTGGILAMASYSASSSAQATTSAQPLPNISRLFEPGSIFKPLVMAAALDAEAINTEYVCHECNQPHTIGQYTITNWDNELHPDANLKDIIKNSDNIGMSYIIQNLGLNRFLSYFEKLGFNQKSGIDLIGEAKPVVKKNWAPIDLATASFGQGIAITQLQMLAAFNSLATDGQRVQPSLLQKTNHLTPVYKASTIKIIKSILKYAVENGTVAKLKPKDVEVCAKSGTAQIALNGSYSPDNPVASYIGFSPCDKPKFTMIVTIDNPRTSPWGSSTAAPIWYDLAQIISNSPL